MDYQCRICLENDTLNNLISPCGCSGNSKYVHRMCINRWRDANASNEKYNRCEVCKEKYYITTRHTIFRWLRITGLTAFIILHICQILFCLLIYSENRHGLILVWACMVLSGIISFYNKELKPILPKWCHCKLTNQQMGRINVIVRSTT